jgi:two-component system response regulator MprA
MTARVLVVDDDPVVAEVVTDYLRHAGMEPRHAADGHAALRLAGTWRPDLVVLDVMLPGLDGVEVCRRLRADGDVPILMLTARDATADRVRGLDSGADDYLAKPFAYEEFLARVRALLRRSGPKTNAVLRYADLALDADAHEVRRGGRSIALTAQEFELLRLFLRHPRQVLSRDQILEAAWGYDSDAVSNVVDVYVGYLRQKLEAAGEPRLLQTVRGVGYVLREEPG